MTIHSNSTADAASFERCEMVTFTAPARGGAIRAGMIGRVIDIYGEPPEFYAITVPEANAWAIVGGALLAAPPYHPRREHALRQRAAPNIDPFLAAGLAPGGKNMSFALGPFPYVMAPGEKVPNAQEQASFLQLYPVGGGFEDRYGAAFEVSTALQPPQGYPMRVVGGFVMSTQVIAGNSCPRVTHLITLPANIADISPK